MMNKCETCEYSEIYGNYGLVCWLYSDDEIFCINEDMEHCDAYNERKGNDDKRRNNESIC